MRRSAGRSQQPAILPPKTLAAAHDSDPRPSRTRRRIRSPAFVAGARRSTGGGCPRSGGATTPLLAWRFDDGEPAVKFLPESGAKIGRKASDVSARKLAAEMWHLTFSELAGGGGTAGRALEPGRRHLQIPYLSNPYLHTEFGSLIPIQNQKNGNFHKLNSAMERETKRDGCSKKLNELCNYPKSLTIVQVADVSVLRAELEQSRSRIDELEAERESSKRKKDRFLRKLMEEKASWRSREHEKVRAIIDGMKEDLSRERRNRQRVEFVNSKLVDELAETKSSSKRILQDYEKERKARELMEEVCDELAKEIGEDKAEVEALKRECLKIREEAEEERKMLQMAEVWREERVQMKLVDAKVTLEEKYSQLIKLKSDLEAFLRSRTDEAYGTTEAESIIEAVNSIKIEEVKEFSYCPPPASEDIFSVFEELQPREENNEREIEQCYGSSPASKIHMVSPETDGFLEKPTKRYSNGLFDGDGEVEDESGWETVSHDEHGSSNSPRGSDPSVNCMREESNNASMSGTDWEESDENGNHQNGEIRKVRSRKNPSSISRLWRSSNGEKSTVEAPNGRLINDEVGLSPPSIIEQWSSPDSVNPHIMRGMKGCIEWPRGMQKHSLKSKLLEARTESQKIQLRHALKQKI